MTPCRLERIGAPVLWALVPGSPKGIAVLKPVCRENFLEAMLKGEYPKVIISPKVFQRRLSAGYPFTAAYLEAPKLRHGSEEPSTETDAVLTWGLTSSPESISGMSLRLSLRT